MLVRSQQQEDHKTHDKTFPLIQPSITKQQQLLMLREEGTSAHDDDSSS